MLRISRFSALILLASATAYAEAPKPSLSPAFGAEDALDIVTYQATLWVIDTRAQQGRRVYPDKRNIRSPRWSPDDAARFPGAQG